MLYYSASENGFYDDKIHGENMPGDVVEIPEAQHQALLSGQSEGQRIAPDEDGYPVLEEVAYDFGEWLDLVVRTQRDARLAASDMYMLSDYPITEIKRGDWATYRQALRDLPTSLAVIVDPIPWPAEPE